MKSLDANVPLRVLLQDNPAQTALAEQLLRAPALLLPTVLLEIVWVMQAAAGRSRTEIAAGLQTLLELDSLFVPDRAAVDWAIARFAAGGDFADLLHVALSGAADSFVTFDQRVERFAQGGVVPVETLRPG